MLFAVVFIYSIHWFLSLNLYIILLFRYLVIPLNKDKRFLSQKRVSLDCSPVLVGEEVHWETFTNLLTH